ncbi:PepSY domain-containing protein [Novosphingobium sp. G106]|uniref:PepSY domain-containing protein n=1 Tax=Novosphingobium sp. G106 TaxID=2849500 RepID=UPI0035C833E8
MRQTGLWPTGYWTAPFLCTAGEAAGLPGRILVALAGLSLPLLYATGLWAWLRRRRINKSIKACEASNPINTGFAA